MNISDFYPPIFTKIYHRLFKNKTIEHVEYFPNVVNSYSQYGEDLIIESIIGQKENGFYIDIGGNDPVKLSNTKRFYDKGWSGINIEPNSLLFKVFQNERLNDINLNIGIGENESNMLFYEISHHEYSTFNESVARQLVSTSKLKIVNTYYVNILSLSDIYSKYVKDTCVDFMSIDTEGFEIPILNGNNWEINRPKLIIIESGNNHSKIYEFLTNKDYVPVCRNHVNSFFVDKFA